MSLTNSMDGIKARCEYVSSDRILVNNCGRVSAEHELRSSRPEGRKDYMLLYIMEGDGFLLSNGAEVLTGAGDMIIWRPYEPLVFGFYGASSHYWLHFTGAEIDKLLDDLGIPLSTVVRVGHKVEISRLFFSIILEMQMNRPSMQIMCLGYFLQLLATLSNILNNGGVSVQISRSKLYPALQAMTSDYSENHPLSYYASLCNLSLSHFKTLFTRELKISPTAYLIRLKTEHARNALRFTDMTVSEIAYMIGFCDPLYFSRFFKKHTGISPSEFRAACADIPKDTDIK